MDWLFDNIQFVIAFAAAFAWWLNKRREDAAGEDEDAPLSPELQDSAMEEEARARRIQEEIRRKIAERTASPPMAPPPVMEPEWVRTEPETVVPPPLVVEQRYDPDAAILEQQRQLQERLRLVEETRRKTAALQTQISQPRMSRTVTAIASRFTPGSLAANLRSRSEVRRAIVMREILGPPKGLQG